MNVTSREEHIADRLSHHWLDEVGAAVSTIPRDVWSDVWPEYGPYARFGVGVPTPWEGDGPALIIPFQAQLIAEVTADLSDEDLDDYLTGIEILTDDIIARMLDDEIPSDEAVIKAEDELYERFSGTLVLLSETQSRALARGVTP